MSILHGTSQHVTDLDNSDEQTNISCILNPIFLDPTNTKNVATGIGTFVQPTVDIPIKRGVSVVLTGVGICSVCYHWQYSCVCGCYS